MLSCEADRKIPSLFWQQVRKLKGNEQKEDKDRIRLDPKGKKEELRRHWQEIFKIQSEDNIEFNEEND